MKTDIHIQYKDENLGRETYKTFLLSYFVIDTIHTEIGEQYIQGKMQKHTGRPCSSKHIPKDRQTPTRKGRERRSHTQTGKGMQRE